MTKIDIISGFLGAGKTTLIKKLLEGPLKGKKVVLIENEFGEIGIDGGFLKDAGIEIKEINSGCICCSLVGDFGTALEEVIKKYDPERIIIEPSGVGKLSDVVAAVNRNTDGSMAVNCATAVVDVTKCKIFLHNFGEFYEDQIKSAGTIVLTRMDLEKVTDQKVDEAISLIKEHNDKAAIITTPIDELDADKLLEVMEKGSMYDAGLKIDDLEDECCHHDHDEHGHHHHHDEHDHHHDEHEHEHHHHDDDEHEHHHHHEEHDECCGHDHHHHHHGHDADEVFTSIGFETAHRYTKEQLENILKSLSDSEKYGMVLRAKGMVPSQDGAWFYFDMVPDECEIRNGSPEYTGKVVVIGSKINEDEIRSLF